MLARDIGTYGAPLDDGASVREGLASFVSYAVSGFIPFLMYALSPVIAYLGGGESASDGMQFFLACLVTTVALIVLAIVKVCITDSTKSSMKFSINSCWNCTRVLRGALELVLGVTY